MIRTTLSVTALALMSLVFTSCEKDKTPEEMVTGNEMQVDVSDYSKWTYINLKTGETQVLRDFSAWNYLGRSKQVKHTLPAQGSPSEIKIDWHIALHYYDVRTNGGSVVATEETDVNRDFVIPTTGYTADTEVENKIYTDMAGMMKDSVGYAAKAVINPVLGGWIVNKGGMPPSFEFTKKVYVARFKDGSYAKLLFTNNTGKAGEKRHVQFSYKYYGK